MAVGEKSGAIRSRMGSPHVRIVLNLSLALGAIVSIGCLSSSPLHSPLLVFLQAFFFWF